MIGQRKPRLFASRPVGNIFKGNGQMENFLIAAGAIVAAFLAGFQYRAIIFRRRRRRQSGFY
jgi:hypothetical protein